LPLGPGGQPAPVLRVGVHPARRRPGAAARVTVRDAASRRARAATVGLVALIAACTTPSPTTSPANSAPAPPPSSIGATSSASVEPASQGAVAIDMDLLALLPSDVDGHPIEASPEAANESATNAEL